MSDKKKPENGTYTQVPNVFFDTCDLPESAQILYLRLYRHIAYKDERKFTGSIRKLSSLVRLSKSTVERMTKILEESRLISISYESSQEQDRKIMTITINPQELWLLNKQHYEDNDVPNWDKVMPVIKVLSQIGTLCPDMGQHTINLGQNNVNLGQTVPDTSSKSEQERISTDNTSNTIERKNGASARETNVSTGEDSSHSFTHSSLNFSSSSQEKPSQQTQDAKPSGENQETKQTKPEVELSPEEQRIHDYWKELKFDAEVTAKLKEHWSKLVDCIQNFEQFKSLYEHTKQQIENNPVITNKRVNPGNLTNANNLNGWKQAQEKKNKVTVGDLTRQPLGRDVKANHEKMVNGVLEDEKKEITDKMIKERVQSLCKVYRDLDIDADMQKIESFKSEFGVSCRDIYESMVSAVIKTKLSGNPSMKNFLSKLHGILASKATPMAS